MHLRSHLLGLGFLVASIAIAPAESPATNTPPGAPQNQEAAQPQPNGTTPGGQVVTKAPGPSHKKKKNPSAAPAPSTAVAAAPGKGAPPAPPILDAYIKDLNEALGLSANEKNEIQKYYLTDAPKLNSILNDPSLSPLQQEQQVSDLRDERNAKIEALLEDTDRRHEFFQVEAAYRVALIDAAADGTLVPATPPPPAAAPSDTAPGEAEPIPTKNSGAK